MNLVGTQNKSTACVSISSDIKMTPDSFNNFANEVGLYVWDDHLDLGFNYSFENQSLRIESQTDVSCVLVDPDEHEELEESTDLVAILQRYMSEGQTVRLVTTFDGPDCFGAAVVKFNKEEILQEVSTNDVDD